MKDNPEAWSYPGNPQCSKCTDLLLFIDDFVVSDEEFEIWYCPDCGTEAVTLVGGTEIVNQTFSKSKREEIRQRHKIWDAKRRKVLEEDE
ncbi:hypothetical protein [Natronosalvus halobius]|uniref:hypothetical protein n=1 Tax=Natronosalvus halobius TaxID=2953746 RepID=UPI0020A0013C|nr:hypothetical protein [Natronosalvus halobius]USZ73250.1 hypothetical protein NGM15_08120 [Natronosalvus halobius]